MTGGALRSRLRRTGPLLAILVLIWLLLWGTWSWANLVSGLVIGLLVMLLLPLPPVETGLWLRPLPALVFLARFLFDVVASSIEVIRLSVRPRPPRGAIISVPVRSDSDLLLAMLSEALCLVPGSIVIDLDREQRVVSLHVLDIPTEEDLRLTKERVLAQEERIVRAFGRPEDIAALDHPPPGAPARRNGDVTR